MKSTRTARSENQWQRHSIGIAALVLGLMAVLARFGLGLSDNTGLWAMGTFGKVALVLGITWLAWPQLQLLKELPGGGVALASAIACMVVFVARPKLLLYFVPMLLSISILFVAITWIQRNLFPPD